jgi:hypothetical protein
MLRSRHLRTLLAAGLVVVVASCSESPNPAEPDTGLVAARGGQAGAPADLPSDAELERQVPGYGGFFLDNAGAPTVYLTRGSDRGNAERALSGYLNGRGLGAGALKVRVARYNWKQLERWQAAATVAAFDGPGVVFVDNDETSNSIRVGVEDLSSMGRVRAALAQSGLPDDAVIIERAAPIVMVASLQNVVDRPVRAGVQINFPGFICSVGFNAISGGQNSMITASHCTNTQGGVESTPYWQPLESVAPTQIATEVDDPQYFRNQNGCPRGRRCRFSDASRSVYINGVAPALGLIARTSGANNNSLEIVGSFSITADDTDNSTPVGTTVHKLGRTTGWTSGTMTNKCVNTGVSGSNIVQLCQNFVTAGVAGGDSGSDVYTIVSSTNVRLEGVLWGGGGGQFVFSPLKNVIQELGPLQTH